MDWLSFPCSVLTRRFQWELGESESDLGIRLTAMAITVIQATATGIIRIDTTDHIRTMAITGVPRTTGPMGIGFTATTVIITTDTDNKLS